MVGAIFLWVMCGIGAAIVASNKGRSVFGWFLLGFLLGPIGFILSLVVANEKAVAEASPIHSNEEHVFHSADERKCPFCAETIKAEAIICRFCNRDLLPIESKQDSAPIAETPSPGIVESPEPPAEPISSSVTPPEPLQDYQGKRESDNNQTRIIAIVLGASLLLVMGGIAYTMTMGTNQKRHDPVSAPQQANKTKWWEDGPVFDIDHEGKCTKFEQIPISLWGNRLRVLSINELESTDGNAVTLAAKYEDGSISELIFYKSLISCNEAIINAKEPAVAAKQPSHPKTVEAPAINVGDKYTYETESTDSDGKTTTATSTREVTAIDGDRVTVTVTSGKIGKARTLIYDRSWNLLETGDTPTAGLIYKPAIQYFDFPLTVGKTWKSLAEDTDKKTGKSRQYVINAEVVGWDEIVVGAGTFDALKIIISSNVIDGEKRSTGTDVSWYAPSIGKTVKSELSGEDSGGRQEPKTVRLESFKVSSRNELEPIQSPAVQNHKSSQLAARIPLSVALEKIGFGAQFGLHKANSPSNFTTIFSQTEPVCQKLRGNEQGCYASKKLNTCPYGSGCEISCTWDSDSLNSCAIFYSWLDTPKFYETMNRIYGPSAERYDGNPEWNGDDAVIVANFTKGSYLVEMVRKQ